MSEEANNVTDNSTTAPTPALNLPVGSPPLVQPPEVPRGAGLYPGHPDWQEGS